MPVTAKAKNMSPKKDESKDMVSSLARSRSEVVKCRGERGTEKKEKKKKKTE